jgi:sterol desaturase/sphingolipid hydroxylase (fatty acid hydroxylase superfamily)
MLKVICVGLGTYALTSFLGYAVHRALHQKWAGRAYTSHRMHHLSLYPPGDLVSESYRSAGNASTVYTFILAFSPLILIPTLLCAMGIVTFSTAFTSVLVMVLVGVLNDAFHDSFHLRSSFLQKIIPGYENLRQSHFVHHVNMKKNFGIYGFFWDKIFKTFKAVQ